MPKLTPNAAAILERSLNQYKTAIPTEQERLKKFVQDELAKHKRAIEIISTGAANDYVNAGKEFLKRIKSM